MKRNTKVNLHLATNDDGLYFWDRIDPEKLRKIMTVLAVMLTCLPVLVSLTVRPWIAILKGHYAAIQCYSMVVGEYWSMLVYVIGITMGGCMMLHAMQSYKGCSLHRICSKKWIGTHWISFNMLLLLVCSTLSYFFTKDKQSALWGDYYCREGLLLFYLYGVYFLTGSWFGQKQMRLVAEVLTAVCALIGILLLYTQGCLLPDQNTVFWNEGAVAPGLFYIEDAERAIFHNRNHLGYFCTICAALVVGLYLEDRNRTPLLKVGRLLEIWLIFNSLALSQTRGCNLAVFVVLICWNLYVHYMRKDLQKKMTGVSVFFLLIVLFFSTGATATERFHEFIEDVVMFFSGESTIGDAFDNLGSGRGFLWKHGIQFALQKPLLGYGPANLMEPYATVKSKFSSPHNDLVLIAASLGLPALFFYLSGLAGHLKGFFTYVKEMSLFEVTLYAAVGGYLVSSFFGTSMYYTTPYYFLLLGFTYGVYRMHRQGKKSDKDSQEEKPAEAKN